MARRPADHPRAPKGAGTDDRAGRIIDAALDLAAIEGWSGLGMTQIAQAAGLTLGELHAAFPSKNCLFDAFIRRVDGEVLAAGPADADEAARDRLFEVLMRRFDALAPHKAAVAAILRDIVDPTVGLVGLPAMARSMAWTLEAAGLSSAGLGGLVRVQGLMLVYADAVRVWLRDDTPDMAKTMAALDKGLRRAETLVHLASGLAPCRRPAARPAAGEPPPA
ncbi:TetR family transcriptional regulator [Shumkonia mesophila]|uniref:TetR family transcriptional regulator n=1 Tax=Shumkonia mesophila TaxID=2838854 RepID=UPI00293449CE|nr:TetR family transcriptional regulator [Shumkonia mesophila]